MYVCNFTHIFIYGVFGKFINLISMCARVTLFHTHTPHTHTHIYIYWVQMDMCVDIYIYIYSVHLDECVFVCIYIYIIYIERERESERKKRNVIS